MLRFTKISKRPHVFFRFSGLTLEQFRILIAKLKPLWEQAEGERLSQRDRKRALGQGRKYKLSTLEDKPPFSRGQAFAYSGFLSFLSY